MGDIMNYKMCKASTNAMTDKQVQAVDKALKKLQEIFKDASKYLDCIEKSRKTASSAIANISNFKEQYSCCERAKSLKNPLDRFPNVINEVQVRISLCIEEKLAYLSQDAYDFSVFPF